MNKHEAAELRVQKIRRKRAAKKCGDYWRDRKMIRDHKAVRKLVNRDYYRHRMLRKTVHEAHVEYSDMEALNKSTIARREQSGT